MAVTVFALVGGHNGRLVLILFLPYSFPGAVRTSVSLRLTTEASLKARDKILSFLKDLREEFAQHDFIMEAHQVHEGEAWLG